MIVLVGFMGAGKTTVGRVLASELGVPFTDTDDVIEARAGMPVARIFSEAGEGRFRALEREAAAELLATQTAGEAAGAERVVALGGGALGDPQTCAALEWHDVVYLTVPFAEALRRAQGGGRVERPLLEAGDPRALYDQRLATYERVARVTVDTAERDVAGTVEAVIDALGIARPRGPRRIIVNVPGNPYPVYVGSGIAAEAEQLIGDLRDPGDAEIAVVVTHPSLRDRAEILMEPVQRAGLKFVVVTVPEGETSKSLAAATALYDELASAGTHRHDLVLALGGGVVCDLAGFVASTYHRGMALVHVPTTLLAQVDAAIGGKTSVNLGHGKNLVGTFYQPRAVICDVDLVGGLPVEELRSGLAEVVKYGLIADPPLLDLVQRDAQRIVQGEPDLLQEVVARSVAIKGAIVATDERESGRRAVLNYGHTFAHAIERASGYGHIRHGEAVALGMMAAAYLAHELGRIDDDAVRAHRETLQACGLPVEARLDLDMLEAAWRHDKKYRRGVKFVLLAGIGRPEVGVDAPRDAVERAIKRMR